MKIFLDTADTEEVRKYFATGLVDGVTNNPSLIRKAGRDPEEVYQEMIDIGVPDVSMEVVGTVDEMYDDGVRLAEKFGTAAYQTPPALQMVCLFVATDWNGYQDQRDPCLLCCTSSDGNKQVQPICLPLLDVVMITPSVVLNWSVLLQPVALSMA